MRRDALVLAGFLVYWIGIGWLLILGCLAVWVEIAVDTFHRLTGTRRPA